MDAAITTKKVPPPMSPPIADELNAPPAADDVDGMFFVLPSMIPGSDAGTWTSEDGPDGSLVGKELGLFLTGEGFDVCFGGGVVVLVDFASELTLSC